MDCFNSNLVVEGWSVIYEKEPIGELVEVDGYNMNVYSVGGENHTLLFLSGSGTACPVLDFRSLYSILEDDYKIVVIEKFGYGFSDIVDTEKSFDTILRQDRICLVVLPLLFGGIGLWSSWGVAELLSFVLCIAMVVVYRKKYFS